MEEGLGQTSQLGLLHQPGQGQSEIRGMVCLCVKEKWTVTEEGGGEVGKTEGYLAYVGVMTKMVGWEGLAGCFWGCLVASDFLICS